MGFCYQKNFCNPTLPVDEAQFYALVRAQKWNENIDKYRETGEAIGNPNATISETMRANSITSRRKDAQLNENNRKAYKLTSLLVAQGKTITEVSKELNDNGYKTPTGKQWQTVQVQRLIALYK